MLLDDQGKKRLSLLCQSLRNGTSIRSFTKERQKQLGGISFSTWSSWERGEGGLSNESLDKLIKFIGCTQNILLGYLSGHVTLEELLRSSLEDKAKAPNLEDNRKNVETILILMKALPLIDLVKVLGKGLTYVEQMLSNGQLNLTITQLLTQQRDIVTQALQDLNITSSRIDQLMSGGKPTEQEWLIIKHVLSFPDELLENLYHQQFHHHDEHHQNCFRDN